MSATARPAAPTSAAVAQSLRRRRSSTEIAVNPREMNGCALMSQSRIDQSCKNRNCERSCTTSNHGASMTVSSSRGRRQVAGDERYGKSREYASDCAHDTRANRQPEAKQQEQSGQRHQRMDKKRSQRQ